MYNPERLFYEPPCLSKTEPFKDCLWTGRVHLTSSQDLCHPHLSLLFFFFQSFRTSHESSGSELCHSSFITINLIHFSRTVSSWFKECETSKHFLQKFSQQIDLCHHLLAACLGILMPPYLGVIFNLPRKALNVGMIRVEPLSSHFLQEALHHMASL